jgi:uncharacterized membrane protein HdeD (DUF308 family)
MPPKILAVQPTHSYRCSPDCALRGELRSLTYWDRLPPSVAEVFMVQNSSDLVRRASTLAILWGVSLIVLGMLAVASPMVAAVAVNVLIAWLVVLAGILHIVVAFHSREAGSVIWRFLVGIAYVCLGAYLIARPALGVASLTLLLASLFLVEGVFNIILFFRAPAILRSSWILFDGIVTLLLGLMIYVQWPSSSSWAIGTLVGVSLIFSGVTRVMVSLAVRKAAASVAPRSIAA